MISPPNPQIAFWSQLHACGKIMRSIFYLFLRFINYFISFAPLPPTLAHQAFLALEPAERLGESIWIFVCVYTRVCTRADR